jgi:hypothetical protein
MQGAFGLLTGAAIALGWLALAPDANAHVRYFGRYGYYDGGLSFGRSPMYAPDQPATIQVAETSRTGHAIERRGPHAPDGSGCPTFLFLCS